ncbi:glutamyl-tRNA reductase [Halococcus qingdaonensis]|uniref:glutamyl-tRNA reductase n=1 Tax=Halococcus qingdaonensis TaxID=224402 RepID=UPI00274280FE|nr:glutamyl-tRNA reductase [Halococcus qingdaonensis]
MNGPMTKNTENDSRDRRRRVSQRSSRHDPSRERTIEQLHVHADRIERRELRTALTKLEQHGTLTDTQQAIVADMADALVDELLASPTQSLRNTSSADHSDVRTALECSIRTRYRTSDRAETTSGVETTA